MSSPFATGQDFIQDLKFAELLPLSNCADCAVHKGFHEDYFALRPQIVSALNGVDTSGGVYITGHSLGAAMAVLAAFDLVRALLHW